MKIEKASDYFLKNPYCILGVSCNAEKEEILKAHGELLDMVNQGREKDYKTDFVFHNLPVIDRSEKSIKEAMDEIYQPYHKLFWFKDPDAMREKYDVILTYRSLGGSDYDVFLALYLYLLEHDPTFVHEINWIQVIRVMRLLCLSSEHDINCFVKGRIIPEAKDTVQSKIFEPLFFHAKASTIEGIGRVAELLQIYYKESLEQFIPFILPRIEELLKKQQDEVVKIASRGSKSEDTEESTIYDLKEYIMNISKQNSKIFEVLNRIKSVRSGAWDHLLEITEKTYDKAVQKMLQSNRTGFAYGICKLANKYTSSKNRDNLKKQAEEIRNKGLDSAEDSKSISNIKIKDETKEKPPIDKSTLKWVTLFALIAIIMLVKTIIS